MYLALRKCKIVRKILKIIRVPDFCPLKPDSARFSVGFRLNSHCSPIITKCKVINNMNVVPFSSKMDGYGSM